VLTVEADCVLKIQRHTSWTYTATKKISQRVLIYGAQRSTVPKDVIRSLLIVTVDCSGNYSRSNGL